MNKYIANYKSPSMGLVWSLFLPGFGQLYNNDYFIGFFLMVWEILINLKAKLNLAIYYAFTLKHQAALETLDYQWALFYPSVYAFSMWQAYNAAIANNLKLEEAPGLNRKSPKLNGLFIGFAAGSNLGLQWVFLLNPIFSTLAGGIIGAVLGHFMEGICRKNGWLEI